MQKTQLAAALVAALGFALNGPAFAADSEKAQATNEKAPTSHGMKVAAKESSTDKSAESSCKGK